MQQRQLVVDVAGDEYRRIATAQRRPVEQRNATLIGRERGSLERQSRDVGGAARGRQQIGEAFDLRGPIQCAIPDHDLVAFARHLGPCIRVEIELRAEDVPGFAQQVRIG